MTTITIPRETFDQMKRALEANHEWHQTYDDHGGYPESELCTLTEAALSAAKAVSAPKLGVAVGELASPEYDQLRAKVQPTAMPFIPWEMLESRAVQPTITNSESRSPIAHLRARTSQNKWNSYELCQADDPNGVAVYTHPQASEPQSKNDACEVLATVLHFIPASEPDLLRDVTRLCHDLRTHGKPQASEPAAPEDTK